MPVLTKMVTGTNSLTAPNPNYADEATSPGGLKRLYIDWVLASGRNASPTASASLQVNLSTLTNPLKVTLPAFPVGAAGADAYATAFVSFFGSPFLVNGGDPLTGTTVTLTNAGTTAVTVLIGYHYE